MLCFLAGALWTLHHGHSLKASLNESQPSHFANQAVMATIKVTSIIDTHSTAPDKKTMRFYGLVSSINNRVLQSPVELRLTWSEPTWQIKQGNELNLSIKIKPAHSLANIGSFDYQSWLLTKNVIASAYVTKSKKHQILNTETSLRQRWYDRYQQHFSRQITIKGVDKALPPLIQALVFGERSQFTSLHWQVLKNTGTQHLIAISGLHIGLVMAIAYGLLSVLLRILPLQLLSLQLRIQISQLNVQPVLLLASFCVALGYGHLANLSIPTLRALTMILVVIAIKLSGYSFSVTRAVLLCVVGVLIVQPLSMLSASFWLSFSALIIIFFTLWRFNSLVHIRQKWLRYLVSLIVLQLTLTLLMMPLTVFLFGQTSQVSLLANLIAVPVVSLVLMPILLSLSL